MSTFATAQAATLLTTWLNREFIKTLEFQLQAQKFATKAVIPDHAGRVGRVNLFPNPPGNATALTEGTNTEHEVSFTTTSADVTIEEYGEWMPVTTLADLAAVAGTREELRKRFNYGAKLAIDSKCLAVMGTTATMWGAGPGYGQATAPASVATGLMSATIIMGAAKQIRAFGTQGFNGISGHPADHLAAIITLQQELDLTTENTTGRVNWSQMVANNPGPRGVDKWIDGYVASIYGVAVYRTQNILLTTGAAAMPGTSYSASRGFVLGDGGFAAMALDQMDPQIYINLPGSTDIGNPYRNKYTIAWHALFGASLGPDGSSRIVKIYSAGI